MAGNFNITTVVLPTALGDTKYIPVLRAPSATLGGGLRIKYAYALENASGQGAGTAYALSLHKFSAAGTPALSGTIAGVVGGTASPLEAGVPQQFVIDADQAFVKADEWVQLYYDEEGGATNPVEAAVVIGWEPGN